MSTYTHDYNNNSSRMQPQHEAFHASVPWPPKDAPVTVTVQRWRRTYVEYDYEQWGIDIVPAHVEYDVKLQLAGAAAGTGDDSREIIVVSAWRVGVSDACLDSFLSVPLPHYYLSPLRQTHLYHLNALSPY